VDPNFLFEEHEHRIYADDYANVYAVVDQEDYWYFSRWRWHPITNSTGKKIYLKRSTNSRGPSFTLYLHVEIHKRTGILKPSEDHTMVDHINGESLFCLRSNLRWATPSLNSQNRFYR
jgi:hypothetical protein